MADHCEVCKFHEGFREKIEAHNRELEIRYDSLNRAIEVAKSEMDRRLEAMNEFRAQLTRQASEFISRKEVEALAKELDLKIAPLKEKSNVTEGSDKWIAIIIQVIISIIVVVVFSKIKLG